MLYAVPMTNTTTVPCPTHGLRFTNCNNTCRPPEPRNFPDARTVAIGPVEDCGNALYCAGLGSRLGTCEKHRRMFEIA